MEENLTNGMRPDGTRIEHEYEKRDIQQIIDNEKRHLNDAVARLKKYEMAVMPDKYTQELYLQDNYATRQIQENLRYAAEKGQTKMRYPTRETAAKIEGYPEKTIYVDEFGKETPNYFEYSDELLSEVEKKKRVLADEIERLGKESEGSIGWLSRYGGTPIWVTPQERSALIDMENSIDYMLNPERNLKPGITKKKVYEYENILKKYTDFPKQYQKLYKGAEVRIVLDPKGNSWYEVDVPEDYLQQE